MHNGRRGGTAVALQNLDGEGDRKNERGSGWAILAPTGGMVQSGMGEVRLTAGNPYGKKGLVRFANCE